MSKYSEQVYLKAKQIKEHTKNKIIQYHENHVNKIQQIFEISQKSINEKIDQYYFLRDMITYDPMQKIDNVYDEFKQNANKIIDIMIHSSQDDRNESNWYVSKMYRSIDQNLGRTPEEMCELYKSDYRGNGKVENLFIICADACFKNVQENCDKALQVFNNEIDKAMKLTNDNINSSILNVKYPIFDRSKDFLYWVNADATDKYVDMIEKISDKKLEEIKPSKILIENLKTLKTQQQLMIKLFNKENSQYNFKNEFSKLENILKIYPDLYFDQLNKLRDEIISEYPEIQKFEEFQKNPIIVQKKQLKETKIDNSEQPESSSEQKDELSILKQQNKQLVEQREYQNGKIIDQNKEIKSLMLEKEKLLKTIQTLTNIQQENKAKSINLKDIYEKYLPQHSEDQDSQNLKSMGEIIYKLFQSDQNFEF